MNSCKRLQVLQTELPPCCVQYYPQNKDLVFISTYKLEDSGKKHGSIDIYKHDPEDLKLITKFETDAVLDLKIKGNIVATCHNTGSIILWRFNDQDISLEEIKRIEAFEETVTSVNFSTLNEILIATCTDGQICSIDITTGDIEYFNTSHELECWISSFGELGELSNVVFTGGDDSKLIAFDLRTKDSIWQTSYKHHDAGVVSILAPSLKWNTSNSNQLWTGSYDDHLRVFDLRVMDKENPSLIQGFIPTVHYKENLGGGVWRLIPSPNDNKVLVCCMYDGARVVDVKDDKFVVSRYFKADHESMCYGGDWGKNYITTCSFYDRIVQRWDPNI